MPRAPRAKLIVWKCPNADCPDGGIWDASNNGKQSWDRHKAKGTCVSQEYPDGLARFKISNPNRITVNIIDSPNAIVNINQTINVNTAIINLPPVFPLGSPEEIAKGLQFSEEDLLDIFGNEEPLHLAVVGYVKKMAAGVDPEFSNIRLPNKGKPDEIHILKTDGVHMLTGRNAYYDLTKIIVPILTKIVSEGLLMSSDFEAVEDIIDSFLKRFDNPDKPFSLTKEERKEIKAGILLALRDDSLRKQKLRIPMRLVDA